MLLEFLIRFLNMKALAAIKFTDVFTDHRTLFDYTVQYNIVTRLHRILLI